MWEAHRGEVLRHLDRLGVGGMVWVWKQAAGADDYGWGVLLEDGSVREHSAIVGDYGRPRLRASSAPVATATWDAGVLTVRTRGAGVLDLRDGAAFGIAAPAVGGAPVVTVDGAAPVANTLTGRVAAAPLASGDAWVGGRELRLTVPAGDHTVVLRPATAGEGPTPAPAPEPTTTVSTTTVPTTTVPTKSGRPPRR